MARGWLIALIAVVVAIGIVAIGAFALFAFVVLPALREAQGPPPAQRAMIDAPAPPVAMPTLDGGTWTLDAARGKTVVLHFWASWCGPCKRQMPYLRAVQERYRDRGDVEIVGVNLDESTDDARAAAESLGLSWTQLHEPGAAWSAPPVRDYKVGSIPSIWVVGPEGRVRAAGLRGDGIAAAVERSLAGGA